MPKTASGLVQLLQPGRQPGDLPGAGVFVDNALGHAAHELRLGGLECGRGGGLIAGGDGFLDLAHGGADQALAVLVDGGAAGSLTDALFGRRMAGHGLALGLN